MHHKWSVHQPRAKMSCAPGTRSTEQAPDSVLTLIRTAYTFKTTWFTNDIRRKRIQTDLQAPAIDRV